MINVGIYGATGYTGYELIGLLRRHPEVKLTFATSRSFAGKHLSDAFNTVDNLPLITAEQADPTACDIVFCCLPHGTTIPTVQAALAAGARVIDLSADFRLHNRAAYDQWYKHTHSAPELLAQTVYGLPERYRAALGEARLVANPGCYPTSVILGLLPLAEAGLLPDQVIVDAKSGVSGAGRSLSLANHFVEANENFSPYKIGHVHQHIPEMEQELTAAGSEVHILFSPHLLPINRGILSTIYVRLARDIDPVTVRNLYAKRYDPEPFVHLLPPDKLPNVAYVLHTNRCVVQVQPADDRGNWIITSAEDNLLKGASGQAVQNMNCMFGFAETTALPL
ncbi:MAG: N-acetyl-gamma-glutamyl-phosphate reductase [Herpetosiphonaceae bacterium]|nr:N-acetyl-gamma-glutamyl-phosphate reductase [Herpetosiphonaceae bacterium]